MNQKEEIKEMLDEVSYLMFQGLLLIILTLITWVCHWVWSNVYTLVIIIVSTTVTIGYLLLLTFVYEWIKIKILGRMNDHDSLH